MLLVVGSACLVIWLLGTALFATTQRADRAQELVARSELVLANLVEIRESMAVIEASHRGFLLTEQASYLGERDRAVSRLRALTQSLPDLLKDRTSEQTLARSLGSEFALRVGLLEQTMRHYHEGGVLAAQDFFEQGASQASNFRMRDLVASLQAVESTRLASLRLAQAEGHAATRIVLLTSGAIGLLVLLPVGFGFASQSRARAQAESRLFDVVASLPGEIFRYRIDANGQHFFEMLDERGQFSRASGADAEMEPVSTPPDIFEPDCNAFSQAAAQAASSRGPLELDFRMCGEDGAVRWMSAFAVPTWAPIGEHRWTGYWNDVHESREAERELRRSAARLQQAQSVARMGDWTLHFETGQVEWSENLFSLFGRDPALGPPGFDESVRMFGEEGGGLIGAAIEAVRATGDTQRYDLRAQVDDAVTMDIEVIATPWYEAEGNMIGLRGTLQDVSERKRLIERLHEAKDEADAANRAKTSFLATMSHEIRTPMYGMMGLLELLGMTPMSPDQRSTLSTVCESGRALQRIIDDILDFSKIEAGKLDIVPEPTSIARVIEGVHRIYSGSASARGLVLMQHCDAAISPALWIDGLRLRQILGNFVSNALKFTRVGQVEIRAELVGHEEAGERVRVLVRDTGIGMTAEQQRRVLEPFVQADLDHSSRSGGTGLGLAICARLADRMEGQMKMDSEPGIGTTMSVEFVLAVADPQELVADSPGTAASTDAQLRSLERQVPSNDEAEAAGRLVLVVDDHPINRMVLQSQLNHLGYANESAEDGAEALRAMARRRFGLIITDCNMPVMSGYELAREIRRRENEQNFPRTVVIACTANVMSGEIECCLEAGMDDHLCKPASVSDLTSRMNRWLPQAKSALEMADALSVQSDGRFEAARDDKVAPPADLNKVEGQVPVNPALMRALAQSHGGDPRPLLSRFQRVNAADAENLLAAAAAKDMDEIVRMAHRMKGAGKLLGADAFVTVCADLELAARGDDQMGIDRCLPRFEFERRRLDAFIAETGVLEDA